jgi:hypothetical protein
MTQALLRWIKLPPHPALYVDEDKYARQTTG